MVCVAVIVPASILTFAPTVQAEPSASAIASAKSLVVEGRSLRDAGNHKAARDKFKAAYALVPTPIIGVDLGREHMALGELLEAREVFVEVTQLPPNSKETADGKAARTEAASLASAVAAKIPTLTISLTGAPSGAKPQVTIDGEAVPAAALSTPRKVNPGTHVVLVKLPERSKKLRVTLAEGATKELTVDLSDDAATADAEPDPTKAESKPGTDSKPALTKGDVGSPSDSGPGLMTYGAFALGGASLLIGGITGAIAMSKASSVKQQCVDFKCPPSTHNDYDSSQSMAAISTVSLAIGAVGVGIGVYGLLSSGKDSPPKAVEISLGVGRIGVSGAF